MDSFYRAAMVHTSSSGIRWKGIRHFFSSADDLVEFKGPLPIPSVPFLFKKIRRHEARQFPRLSPALFQSRIFEITTSLLTLQPPTMAAELLLLLLDKLFTLSTRRNVRIGAQSQTESDSSDDYFETSFRKDAAAEDKVAEKIRISGERVGHGEGKVIARQFCF